MFSNPKNLVLLFIIIAVGIFIFYWLFLRMQMGTNPSGDRLKNMEQLPYFKKGMAFNLEKTPQLAEGENFLKVLIYFIFNKDPQSKPKKIIPSDKTDLSKILPDENILIWFGHSTYFIQLDGRRILVDPVMSGHASPLPFLVKAFAGTDIYKPNEIPFIDYLLITHDHYDHLDYETILALQNKFGKIITGLGVGEILQFWNISSDKISELVWNETVSLNEQLQVTFLPARHFSGRGFQRNKTLWGSFALKGRRHNLYLGGDSGYGAHFKKIGQEFGPFDLAILENGQYDEKWKYIHMLPADALKAAIDLNAKSIFPVHNSKFILANHAWNAPLNEITRLNKEYKIPLKTPRIGEKVNLDNPDQKFSDWWKMKDKDAD